MSFEASAWAIKQSPETPIQKLVLIALADCFNTNTTRCDPSNIYLAQTAMCSERSVVRAVAELEKQGFIYAKHERGKRTNYTLNTSRKSSDTESVVTESHSTNDRESPEVVTACPESSDTVSHKPVINQEFKPVINQENNSPVATVEVEPEKPKGKKSKFTDDDLKTAEWVYSTILTTCPRFKKPNLDDWANTVRLMREQDHRDHRSICEVFRFANRHEFWSANVLSMKKLRKHYDTLSLQLQRAQVVPIAGQPAANGGYKTAQEKRAESFLSRHTAAW